MAESNLVWEELPDKVVLYNPAKKITGVGGGSKIVDYPISELVVDGNGNPVTDRMTGQPKTTGETFEWSLDPEGTEYPNGEVSNGRAIFPKYVAKILKERFEFLRIEIKKVEKVSEAPKEKADQPTCPHCDIPFGTQGVLQKHIDEKHSTLE